VGPSVFHPIRLTSHRVEGDSSPDFLDSIGIPRSAPLSTAAKSGVSSQSTRQFIIDVVVTGIGLVSALGNRQSTWAKLLNGQSGIRLHQPFAELARRPIGLIASAPADLRTLTTQAVRAALQDAGLRPPLVDCAVVVGSSRGHQASWETLLQQRAGAHSADCLGPTAAKTQSQPEAPIGPRLEHWLDTLLDGAARVAAQILQTQAIVLSPMNACATGIAAISRGCELIESGQADRAIVGAIEAPVTPLTLAGFTRLGALATTGAYPFDRQREGLVIGEGGAILVLETAALANARSAPIYGRIRGFGLTADGYHATAPDPTNRGAVAAVQQCLRRSGLMPADIDYIHAHGTATALNDRQEAAVIRQLFGPDVPVSSTKGATGHTLGGSGALGVAFCLMALRSGHLPPCVGLRQSDFDLNLLRQAVQGDVQTALCFSFGFGGQNGVLAVSR
jgi:3-oxoacyl-[acyl-carrier-protein] synthase II